MLPFMSSPALDRPNPGDLSLRAFASCFLSFRPGRPHHRYERGSTIVTRNLPFDEWTGIFASERLTGTLLDRLTHHVHILEMNGDSYRLKHSKRHTRADDRPDHDPAPDAEVQEGPRAGAFLCLSLECIFTPAH
jgi:hypothetical protein